MANFDLYRLHFSTPVHLGDSREDYGVSLTTIQSDTMYASITACLAKIGVPIPDDGDLGCHISSLFPFYQNEEKKENETIIDEPVYFFPKPLKQNLPILNNLDSAKKIKKVKWLDLNYFEKVINGKVLFENEEDVKRINGDYLANQEINIDFIQSQVSPRVMVSRTATEDAMPFYMDRIYFKKRSGLFFLVTGDTTLLDKGLGLLQEEGIGTDRNVGNGFFYFEKDSIEINLPVGCINGMSLSIFIPESKEQLSEMLSGENVAYHFVRRGGWITTPPYNTVRKNVIHAFFPASTFSIPLHSISVKGKTVDLTPHQVEKEFPEIDHPVWRCGKSIFIPVKI